MQRRLTAILAADVVGFSRLAAADEEGTVSRLRALRHELIDPVIATHHGRIVKTTGDGVLTEFGSVVDAMRAALEVQRGVALHNENVAPEKRIEFRIGIHLGDVIIESDGDLMGDGVNIAARLEGIAEPGGICLSSAAYEQVRDKVAADFADLGEQQLKNIPRPVRVYAISPTEEEKQREALRGDGPTAEQGPPSMALPDKPSIAVLPFQNMSGDPEQEYFADGMVEDIITGLARINWLFVIARNSSFAYKGKSPDIRQVGRELGVRYVLEGSVRKAGNRVRITGQLVEAESGTHLWADKFDGALEDVFDLQDKITETVVGVIEPNVRRAEIERARRKRPDSLGAYDLYLRALPHFASVMPADGNIGIGYLEQALALDPNYAVAHAYLSWGLEIRVMRAGFNEADAIAGVRHARLALTYGTDDSTALGAAAVALLHLGHDYQAAAGAVARALSLNGSCTIALFWGAHINGMAGNAAVAEDYALRALRLSPFDPLSFLAYTARGFVCVREGRYAEAGSFLFDSVQANPGFSVLHFCYTAALALAGRDEEARSAAQRALELEPSFRTGRFIANFSASMRPELVNAFESGLRKAGLPK
jgi:TolB-like protein